VQPYAFTTKSLYVGHTDYKYLRWQVVDTPGILDHPLEDRNTIEMQAITALAHLRAAVLYFLDPSEQCGHTLDQQKHLFDSIRPLFNNKPLVVISNKMDVVKRGEFSEEKEAIFKEIEKDIGREILEMSTVTEEGVMEVKTKACDLLLQHRVELKFKSKKVETILNRLHVAEPVARDTKERPAFVPEAALRKQKQKQEQKMDEGDEEDDTSVPKRKTEREIELEEGDDYIIDLKKNYDLANPDHKYDVVPETWQGHNVADFIDPDIMEKLEKLEAEEEARERAGFYESEESEVDENYEEIKDLAGKIRRKKGEMKTDQWIDQTKKPTLTRTSVAKKRERSVSRLKQEFETLGVTGLADDGEDAHFNRAARSASRGQVQAKRLKLGSDPHMMSHVVPRDQSGIRPGETAKLKELGKKRDKKVFDQRGKAGESDRRILEKKPKHLYSGKRGIGKTDRR
jgi:nucleolar GTP-binding protein